MATDNPPKKLLSAGLDFEGLDSISLDDLKVDSPISEVAEVPSASGLEIAQPSLKKHPVPEAYSQRLAPSRKKSLAVVKSPDRFNLYVVLVVIVSMIVASFGIYLYTRTPRNAAGLSYVALPQIIINLDGQVARLQVTVQIDAEDTEWLSDNKKEINDIFNRAIVRMNPDELRSKEGFAAVQVALREQLNTDLRSEKIQAVLLTELLVQDQQ
ncbi:hypothetical protein BH11PSE12_BH11PSE12_01580 [soil metagenome]